MLIALYYTDLNTIDPWAPLPRGFDVNCQFVLSPFLLFAYHQLLSVIAIEPVHCV